MNLIPNYIIKYKNESTFMKMLGYILFFNPGFMKHFSTTIGHTIYLPSKEWQLNNAMSFKILAIHENVHIKDSEKYSSAFFSLSYLFPQILALPAIILFACLKPLIAALVMLIFILPLPALFRTIWEKKAYSFSLYTWHLLEAKYGITPDYNIIIDKIVSNFTSPNYYFMCPWMNKSYFEKLLTEFKSGNKPYYSIEYYQMAEDLLDKLMV